MCQRVFFLLLMAELTLCSDPSRSLTSSIHVARFDGRADCLFCPFSVLEIVRPRGSVGLESPEVVSYESLQVQQQLVALAWSHVPTCNLGGDITGTGPRITVRTLLSSVPLPLRYLILPTTTYYYLLLPTTTYYYYYYCYYCYYCYYYYYYCYDYYYYYYY